MMQRFDRLFTTNKNAHIGAPENEEHINIITKCAKEDFLTLMHESKSSLRERVEGMRKKGNIGTPGTNFNEAIDAVLQIIDET